MYTEKDLVKIARRENNQKRNYLVVNPLQGKHIPVKPREAFALFERFADSFLDEYKEERVLYIGFAETATAIGAAVAVRADAPYIQTTRETIPGVEYLFFSEEHSHATEQKLVKDDIDQVIGSIDRIIFIEDEITTGKTIHNIIHVLEREYSTKIKYSAASLLNGMDESAWNTYQENGIRLHYLVRVDHGRYASIADAFSGNGTYISCNVDNAGRTVTEIKIGAGMNTRRFVHAKQYQQACSYLWHEINERIHIESAKKVLVLGTEEFMYPALFVAGEIERMGADVVCHATTRSPILVGNEPEYPLHVRYELRSMYDQNRVTFVYDLAAYDMVLVLTDSPGGQTHGVHSLVNALIQKNQNIFIIRWVEM